MARWHGRECPMNVALTHTDVTVFVTRPMIEDAVKYHGKGYYSMPVHERGAESTQVDIPAILQSLPGDTVPGVHAAPTFA